MAYVASTFSQVSDIRELSELLSEEFSKIEDEMASAQGAATLFVDVPKVGVANIVPRIVDEWDQSRPNRDFRAVVPDLPGNQIVAARSGQYFAQFTVTATIDFLRDYVMTMFINGLATDLTAVVDPSNQTDLVTMVSGGSARVPRESERDAIDLRISSDQDAAQFDIISAFFSVFYVGD